LAWWNFVPEIDSIIYKRSTNGGTSFGDNLTLNENSVGNAGGSAPAASGNKVYAARTDSGLEIPNVSGEIMYRRNTEGGVAFVC